jgi:predicted CXXCH cytochrome family protein
MLFLLCLYCFVVAQIHDGSSGKSIFSINNAAAIEGEQLALETDELYQDIAFDDEEYVETSEEEAAGEIQQERTSPYEDTQTDDAYLDDLIDDEPVITEPPPSAPIQDPPPTVPSEPQKSVEPVTTGQSTPSSINQQQSYSSSPDINMDEAKIQESPDIPKFTHKAHIEDVGAECVQCHQTLFSESVKGYKVGPSQKEICSQCHNGTDAPAELLAGFTDEKKYVKATMPLFSHTKHLENTEECITCHKDIYGPVKKIKTPPPMSDCMKCHNNHKASGDCKICHEDTRKLKPRSHSPRWVYRNGHGNRARYNQKQCDECHADRECNLCHRGQSSFSVHRPGYKLSHGMDARQRIVNCGYCHDLENNCVQCHIRKR